MLVIRYKQFKIFEEHCHNNFCSVLALKLRKEFPKHFDSSEQSESFVDRVITKCEGYDIGDEDDVIYIAQRMVEEGEDFEHLKKNEFIKKILESKEIPSDDKIYEINKRQIES